MGGELGESPVVGLVYKRGNQAAAVGQIGVVWKVRGCLQKLVRLAHHARLYQNVDYIIVEKYYLLLCSKKCDIDVLNQI